MGKTYRKYEPNQEFLLPPNMRDWLPEGHLAFFISEVVDGMERIQQCSILCPDSLHQMAMKEYLKKALSDGSLKQYIEKTRLAYEKAAKTTLKAIDEHLCMPRLEPDGGLYTVMKVNEDSNVFY